jgi:hypothetical protein
MTRSGIKLVTTYVFFRSGKQKRDQQWEGSSESNMKFEATTTELQKVKGQLQDGAMEGDSTSIDGN